MKRIWILAALCLPAPSLAAVEVDWVHETAGVSIAIDALENVYTVAYEYNPAGDILLTKRDLDGALLWETKYDQVTPSLWEKATWVATDGSGNVVVSGTLMSGYSNPVNAASLLMKFEPDGDLVWRQVYESSFDGSYTRKCLIDAEDNIYVLGMGSGPAGYVTKVAKFAPDGTRLWTYFDADGIGAPINLKFAPDGDLMISARSIFGSINGYARIDRDGLEVWSFPGVSSLTVGDVDSDDTGNSYLVHGEYVMNGGSVVKKLGPTGELLWSHVYELSAFRVEVGSDQHPVICGFPDSGTPGASFLELDGDGEVVWANPDADGPLGLLLHAQLLMDADDNVYLAAGTMTEMAVCKVTGDGASEWTATTSGSYANAIAIAPDGDVYVVGGNTARLLQQTAAASPDLGGAELDAPPLVRSSPNPCREGTTIEYVLPVDARVELQLIDATGRVVTRALWGPERAGSQAHRIDTRSLAAGVYRIRWSDGTRIASQSLVVLE